jgi:hypothetical protein
MSTPTQWKPELFVGGTVLWHAWGSHEPPHLIEGKVVSLHNLAVTVRPELRWFWLGTAAGFYSQPIFAPHHRTIPRKYFEMPITEYLGEASEF